VRRVGIFTALLLFFALLASSSAVASSITGSLHGELVTESTSASGALDFLGLNQSAIFFEAGDDRPAVRWTATAHTVTVNWTHITFTSAGRHPLSGDDAMVSYKVDQEVDEKTYKDGRVIFDGPGWRHHQIFAVSSADRSSLTATGDSRIVSSDGKGWKVGYGRENGGATAGHEILPVEHFRIPVGDPIMSLSKADLSVTGDFVVYVWGGTLDVAASGSSTDSYRSGVWFESAAGPAGAAVYEEHRQLLRVTFTNATLEFGRPVDQLALTQSVLKANVIGAVSGVAIEGAVEGNGEAYRLDDAPFDMQGVIDIAASGHGAAGDRLMLSFDADQASFSSDDIRSGNAIPAAASSSQSTGPIGPAVADFLAAPPTVIVFILILAGLAALLGSRRRNSNMPPHVHQALAEQALIEGRPRRARRHARWILRHEDDHPEGWFLTAASYAQQEAYARLVKVVGPAVDALDANDRPSVAFLLAIACHRLGRRDEGRAWARIAAKNKEMRARLAAMDLTEDAGPPRRAAKAARVRRDGLVAYA
jgi:hypothetical protein